MILSIHGKTPDIDKAAYIALSADLIGDVSLADNVSIWFHTVIRGDGGHISIGEGSNVQDNCTLHTDPGKDLQIGARVSIGHNAVVHCSSVGDETLIGMNSTILADANIGKGCIIGAGAVVTEGAVIPDHSLVVGVPGKILRQITEEDMEHIRHNAKVYLEKARTYRDA